MGPIVDARARMSSPTRETTTTSDGDGRGTFTADDALEATLSEAVRENLEAVSYTHLTLPTILLV